MTLVWTPLNRRLKIEKHFQPLFLRTTHQLNLNLMDIQIPLPSIEPGPFATERHATKPCVPFIRKPVTQAPCRGRVLCANGERMSWYFTHSSAFIENPFVLSGLGEKRYLYLAL